MGVRYGELTDKDRSYIRAVHSNNELTWDQRMLMLRNRYSVSERTIRRWIKRLGISAYSEEQNDQIRAARLRQYGNRSRYIITWAQNATPVHAQFWSNILAYAEHLDAEVGVIQGRYRNPTSVWDSEDDQWWDDVFFVDGHTYLDSSRHVVHENVEFLSNIKIRPTAVKPLTGLEGVSGHRTCVLGHPKVHLKSLPILRGHPNKLLMTTGACTIKNYTDSKAGKKAEFHHTYGFVIIEIKDDKTYYIRQVTANRDGSFRDINRSVVDGEVSIVDRCSAFVMGDLHIANVYEPVVEKTMELFARVRPERIILHDTFDGESINHHERKNPIKAYHRRLAGRNLLGEEIRGVKNFIEKYELLQYNPVIVRSNHDVWISRWISDHDWKKDIPNAKEYMEYSLLLLSGEAEKGILPYILEAEYGDRITTLGLDDSFRVNGWELGQHGHLGAHGSRGNIDQFRKLNTKIVVGDFHKPERLDGALGVGTYSELRMGYNNGPSAWMHAGVMIHEDGKAQHIIFAEDDNFTTIL